MNFLSSLTPSKLLNKINLCLELEENREFYIATLFFTYHLIYYNTSETNDSATEGSK